MFDPFGELAQERLEEALGIVGDKIPSAVEQLIHAADVGFRLLERSDIQTYQQLSQMMIRAKTAEGALGGAYHSAGLSTPHALPVGARADVKSILENRGNGAVIFRGNEENSVNRADLVAERRPRGRWRPFVVKILIIERKITDLDDLQLKLLWC